MSSPPLVSIIVDNFDYERYLREAIDSALAQNYPRVEVVVVDDGSRDGSREIIASYGTRIVAVLKENGGQASAFNAGLAAASGEIVLFLDADDYLYPDAVEQVVARWTPELSKLSFRLDLVTAEGAPIGQTLPPGRVPLPEGSLLPLLLSRGSIVTPPTTGNAFARRALEAVLPIPEEEYRISADGYLVVATAFEGPVAADEASRGAYRVHGSNGWMGSAFSPERLHGYVAFTLRQQRVLEAAARRHGRALAPDLLLRDFMRVRDRLASLRLDPAGHPLPGDGALQLLRHGLRALWSDPSERGARRLAMTLWLLWIGLMPRALAAPVVRWFYAPDSRPRILRRRAR